MQTRTPIVAGQFYPGREDACIGEIDQYLAEAEVGERLPETIVAGIVPHAGWTFSGALAAMVFAAVKKRHENVDTFVLLGAAHSYFGRIPAVFDSGRWLTPLGEVSIDEELAAAIVHSESAAADPDAHESEHSIEVQVPFIQRLFPEASIVPIVVPPNRRAVSLGETVGRIIVGAAGRKIVCIGSTDLTHYGPRYGFTPMGTGSEACHWASQVNDRQFIELALKMDAGAMLANAAEHHNACGPGAAAAAVAAARELGRKKGVLLGQTNSNEVMLRKMGTTGPESVGYAAIVF